MKILSGMNTRLALLLPLAALPLAAAIGGKDISKVALPLAAAIGLVGLVCYFWPRVPKHLLDKTRKAVRVMEVVQISHDTKKIRLSTGHKSTRLGLPIGKHIRLFAPNPQKCLASGKWNGQEDPDKGALEIHRNYTPTPEDYSGYVDIVTKIYRPGTITMPDGKEVTWADGGKMSLYLDSLKVGDSINIYGPIGVIEYLGCGKFKVPGGTKQTNHVGMMAGGTGITPMLQVVAAAMKDKADTTRFSLIYANKTKDDILVKDLLEEYEQKSNGRFKVHYTLDYPPEGWEHQKGFITANMIYHCLPPPEEKPVIFMCGPPPMVKFACEQNLVKLKYDKDSYFSF